MTSIKRVSTGVPSLDKLIAGGIPEGFMVAAVGEPGTGKTIFSIHFANQGVLEEGKVIYVTTEESRESIIRQAGMFGFDFSTAIKEGKMVIIDALMKGAEDLWSLQDLTVEALIDKIIEAKKYLGYGHARLVIDSMSAFWLDKPAMARKYSYQVKRTLYKWGFTILATSQYAITTEKGFGFGIEHVADGIIRFSRHIHNSRLDRMLLVEKMRQTPHDLRVWIIDVRDKRGLVLVKPAGLTRGELYYRGEEK